MVKSVSETNKFVTTIDNFPCSNDFSRLIAKLVRIYKESIKKELET